MDLQRASSLLSTQLFNPVLMLNVYMKTLYGMYQIRLESSSPSLRTKKSEYALRWKSLIYFYIKCNALHLASRIEQDGRLAPRGLIKRFFCQFRHILAIGPMKLDVVQRYNSKSGFNDYANGNLYTCVKCIKLWWSPLSVV